MNDIATRAGVSRQTVYDLFDGKDALIRASIRSVTDQNLAQVSACMADCESLADRLDIYFDETIVKSFRLLQSAAEPEDLISGHNEAGGDEITRSHRRHEALVANMLTPYAECLEAAKETPESIAHFIVTTIMGFKHQATDMEDLLTLLNSLKFMIGKVAVGDEVG